MAGLWPFLTGINIFAFGSGRTTRYTRELNISTLSGKIGAKINKYLLSQVNDIIKL